MTSVEYKAGKVGPANGSESLRFAVRGGISQEHNVNLLFKLFLKMISYKKLHKTWLHKLSIVQLELQKEMFLDLDIKIENYCWTY